jgi:hypothetical protein
MLTSQAFCARLFLAPVSWTDTSMFADAARLEATRTAKVQRIQLSVDALVAT